MQLNSQYEEEWLYGRFSFIMRNFLEVVSLTRKTYTQMGEYITEKEWIFTWKKSQKMESRNLLRMDSLKVQAKDTSILNAINTWALWELYMVVITTLKIGMPTNRKL